MQGADVNAKDKDEISGLMEAAIMGHVDVVKELLKVCAFCLMIDLLFSTFVLDLVCKNRLSAYWKSK